MRHLVALCLLTVVACTPEPSPSAQLPNPLPPTPTVLFAGDSLFVVHCRQCHGQHALGSDRGPPLLHATYAPGHHADIAFLLAVRNGVRAHHWRYGDMPAIAALTDAQVGEITAYVRWLQVEAGIH